MKHRRWLVIELMLGNTESSLPTTDTVAVWRPNSLKKRLLIDLSKKENMLTTKLSILILVASCFSTLAVAHESREISGMNLVFGGEPEPMFTGEKQFLRWRLTELKTDEPVSDLEDMQMTVKIDGKEYGPFEVRESWQNAGTYQTMHIFTQAGDGMATLNYKGTEKVKGFSESFQFSVRARETISIP